MVGCITLLVLQFSPMSMNEIKEWQNQAQKERDAYVYGTTKILNIGIL